MEIINQYNLIDAAKKWQPRFTTTNSIDECADLINLPHEDYPQFVNKTKESIELAIDILKERPIKEFDIKALHGFCMKEKEYIRTGDYRILDGVIVGSFKPPHPMYVPQLMISICPVDKDIENIEMWYRLFECIHPFEDGNGRVGGIILAAVSFLKNGTYTCPKQ